MTLNGVMAVTLRDFTEFGKPALQKTICGGIYARVYCIFSACTMSSQKKFTFAISSPDVFLVYISSYSKTLSRPIYALFSVFRRKLPDPYRGSTLGPQGDFRLQAP